MFVALLFIVLVPVDAYGTITVGPGQPFRTIQGAVDIAVPGDIIVVYSGTYDESVVINTAGLTIVGLDTGSGLPVVNGNGSLRAFRINADNTTIGRFNVIDTSSGILVLSNNNTIFGNTFYNTSTGIGVTGSYNYLVGNTANDNRYCGIGISTSSGICTNNIVIGNTANGNKYANILIDNASYNTVVNNIINDSPVGIYLHDNSQYNTIGGNNAYNNSAGIRLIGANNNSLVANVLAHGADGICFTGSNDSSVTGNSIRDNTISGFEMAFSQNNTIWLNTLNGNANDILVAGGGRNFWNSTTKLTYTYGGSTYTNYTGNYWDNEQAPDGNGDGIVDSYYGSDIYNLDFFPMMMGAAPAGRVMNLRTGLTYPTIGDAIDDADPLGGDTLLAGSGDYPESVIVHKTITLIGLDNGSGLPVVKAAGGSGTAITIVSDDASVLGFNATGSQWGIDIEAYNANVIGNNASGNTAGGILVYPVANCDLLANTVINSGMGIELGYLGDAYGSNNRVIGNVIVNNPSGGIIASGSDNVIAANIARGDWQGIHMVNCTGNTVAGNMLSQNTDYGIFTMTSSDDDISGNYVVDNKCGIYIYGTDQAFVSGNIVSDNDQGGIYVHRTNDSFVPTNIVSSNDQGIILQDTTGNDLYRNIASNNTGDGIILQYCSNTNVRHNNMTGNMYGIHLYDSSDNVLWLNVIANNTVNGTVSGQCTNHWNSTAQLQYTYAGSTFTNYTGNFWGDYEGPDANVDGIGDKEYPIFGDNPDYYPMLGESASTHQSVAIQLKKGWNLISVPLNVTDNTVEAFFPADVRANMVNIWGWNETAQDWAFYSPDSSAYFYGYYPAMTKMEAGRAYWVEMNASKDFTIEGAIPGCAPASPVALVPGWNFMGITGLTSQPVADIYPDTINVWAWNATAQDWMFYSPDPSAYFYGYYPALTTLQPGDGHWVEMEA